MTGIKRLGIAKQRLIGKLRRIVLLRIALTMTTIASRHLRLLTRLR